MNIKSREFAEKFAVRSRELRRRISIASVVNFKFILREVRRVAS